MKEWMVKDKTIRLYGADNVGSPVIYLNTDENEGEDVWRLCQEIGCSAFSLVTISGLVWERDMILWETKPIFTKDSGYSGGADEYLEQLCGLIKESVEENLSEKPIYSAIAGYSLGGLFAVYASYKTNMFSRIASASGSFWFPDFLEYTKENSFITKPEKVYFSLGEKESKTKNPVLSKVQENTEALYENYLSLGIETTFVLQEGGHFTQPNERMAKGIQWILLDK